MGLLDKQNAEKLKYINAIKFMNLIAFTTKESIENIVSYLVNEDFEKKVSSYHIDRHARISQNNHTQGFGFDVNTRKFLDNCYSYSFFDNYIYYGDVNKVEGDFYYLIDELKSVDFITSLAINFDLLKDVERAVTAWHKEQQNPIHRIFKPSFEKPNYDQVDYMKQDSFSIMDAAGLLAGVSVIDIEQYRNHPKFTELYADYISYKLMIELALTNKELNYKHDSISAIDLQEYLFKMGYIIKGFNDWLTIEPAKPLKNNKEFIELGEYQKQLITYDDFTPEQIICLIIDRDPNYVIYDREFRSYWNMIESAINIEELTAFNEGMQIEAEQVKVWLAQNNYIYEGFNDHIQTDPVAYIKQLTERLSAEKLKVAELESQLKEAKSKLADKPANESKLQSIEWENMSEHIYPPELHLAMMIWQRIYWDNELKDSHITSHNGKYEVIANKINLNPKSTLGKRVGMVINNAFTKNKQTELAEQLHAISGINMSKKI